MHHLIDASPCSQHSSSRWLPTTSRLNLQQLLFYNFSSTFFLIKKKKRLKKKANMIIWWSSRPTRYILDSSAKDNVQTKALKRAQGMWDNVKVDSGGQGRVTFHWWLWFCRLVSSACCRTGGEWCRRRCRLQSLICRWISSILDPSARRVLSLWGLELPLCTWRRK